MKFKIFEDNNGCIPTCTAPKMTRRTKHIAFKYHFVRKYFNLDPTDNRAARHPHVLKKLESANRRQICLLKDLMLNFIFTLRKIAPGTGNSYIMAFCKSSYCIYIVPWSFLSCRLCNLRLTTQCD
jgi:hypothetical protein